MANKFTQFYFRLIAVITLCFGLVLLIFPSFAAGLFFNHAGNESLFFLRVCGSTLIGYATLNWLTAHANQVEIYRIAAWSNLVTLSIASILSLMTIRGFDSHVWLLVVQHLVFALGFGYCLVRLK